MVKKIGFQIIVQSDKIQVPKNFWVKKKKCWVKKIWVQKYFGSKKIVGSKKFESEKYFESKISGLPPSLRHRVKYGRLNR